MSHKREKYSPPPIRSINETFGIFCSVAGGAGDEEMAPGLYIRR